MARRADADIAWRAGRLGRSLCERVGGDTRIEGFDLAMMHLSDANPRTAALAHAVFQAALFDIDTNNVGYRARMIAAQRTRRLAHSIRAWAKQVEPIVTDNRRRIEQLGANARMFPSHEIPERVENICLVFDALNDLADLFARQLYFPEMVPAKPGKPADPVLNEITRLLHEGGFTLDEIADLTDRGAGDKIKRVRHRIGDREAPRPRVLVPISSDQPIKPTRRTKVRPKRPRR